MVAVVDTAVTAEATERADALEPLPVSESTGVTPATPAPMARRRRKVALGAAVLLGLVAAGTAGYYGPALVDQLHAPSYAGESAATVAKDLGCTEYQPSPTHDESVYKYHDQGTCMFNGTRVKITTFEKAADGDAFLTLMNGLIPVVHPTWVGAATAAGDGWNVADATNLSPEVAEAVVMKLGAGEVRVIPSAVRT